MILNIAATLFVIGITFINSMFGLFSGLINAFCAIVAMVVALGFWEPLNDWLTGDMQLHPGYTEPFALALLFLVTLLVLRLLADNFVRGNVRVPMYVDWGGGAICGFVIAQIAVGIMVLSFLMLPFGGQAGQYRRIVRHEDNELDPDTQRAVFVEQPLWFHSADFTIGLFELLSHGSLKGTTPFATVYPDFPEWVYWTGNTVQYQSLAAPVRDDKGDGFERGVEVESWWRQRSPIEGRYRKEAPTRESPKPPYLNMTYEVLPGNELIGLRVTLLPAAADRGEKQQPQHRFRPSQIRLVGDVNGKAQQSFPTILGGADPRIGANYRIADIDANFSIPGREPVPVDLYFEVEEGFTPRFVEYRRHARAPVTGATLADGPPSGRLAAAGGAGDGRGGARGSGAARFIDAINRRITGDRVETPIKFNRNVIGTKAVDLQGGKFAAGTITGDVDDLEGKPPTQVTEFHVPDGTRLFQLETQARQAQSLAGQVLNYVAARTNQYFVVDNLGDEHPLKGFYAIVERDGREYIEVTYEPENLAFRPMLQWRWDGMSGALQKQDNARLGMIFLVPPGRCMVAVKSQGGRVDFGREFCVRSD